MRSNGYNARHTRNVLVGEPCANIDYKYGPYSSVQEAFDELSDMEVLAVGLTVGISTSDGIEEYWFKNRCSNANDLVPKITQQQDNNSLKAVITTRSNYNSIAKDINTLYLIVNSNDEIVAMYYGTIPFKFVSYEEDDGSGDDGNTNPPDDDPGDTPPSTTSYFILNTSVLNGNDVLL